MTSKAYSVQHIKPSLQRWFPARLAYWLWMSGWLLGLALLFSGVSLPLGPFTLKTIRLDSAFIAEWWPFISRGIVMTFELSIISIVCATVLALLTALARLGHNAPLRSLASLYVSLMRGTPLFLQIVFVYMALPQVGLVLNAFTAAVLALSLNYGAYMSEIFRAGIAAVGRGQSEAAAALGLTRWQRLRYVVLPQAFRIVTPDIGNQFIAMQKDTALASAIAVQELMGLARQAGAPRQHLFEALVVAAVWYWLLTIVLSVVQVRLERFMARADR